MTQSAHPMPDGANIKTLTSLRFIAAMWVVLYHYWPNLTGTEVMPGLVAKGYLGPVLGVIAAVVFLVGLYAGFQALAGFPLTAATIRWGALRIVPCFALGCALHNLWRARPAVSRPWALAGAAFSGGAVLTLSALGA